jgi:thiol:disulfide interchange protein DsbD
MAFIVIGSWLIRGPGVSWQTYSDELLLDARGLKKPVIIDFYADWCSPCLKLDKATFHDPEIVKQAGRDFVMIKVNLTRGGNPVYERLLRKYGIKGVPTIVFLDNQGKELPALRLVDFVPPNEFLMRMAMAKKGPGTGL